MTRARSPGCARRWGSPWGKSKTAGGTRAGRGAIGVRHCADSVRNLRCISSLISSQIDHKPPVSAGTPSSHVGYPLVNLNGRFLCLSSRTGVYPSMVRACGANFAPVSFTLNFRGTDMLALRATTARHLHGKIERTARCLKVKASSESASAVASNVYLQSLTARQSARLAQPAHNCWWFWHTLRAWLPPSV